MGTILLVEDEVLIADMIIRMLDRSAEVKVVLHALNMPEAIEHLGNVQVDLVLLDINLSAEQSGLDLAEHLNNNGQVPIIYLTSLNDRETLGRVKSTGPVAYLNKPVNEAVLLTTVELALANRASGTEEQISIAIGSQRFLFRPSELLLARADHVYTDLHFTDRKETIRMSLGKLLQHLPNGVLVQVNRGEAVNPKHIQKVSRTKIWLTDNSELRLSPKFRDLLD